MHLDAHQSEKSANQLHHPITGKEKCTWRRGVICEGKLGDTSTSYRLYADVLAVKLFVRGLKFLVSLGEGWDG